jgi:hypothetical protein
VAVLRRYQWHAGILLVYRTATDSAAQTLARPRVHFDTVGELPAVRRDAQRRDGAILIWDDTAISSSRRHPRSGLEAPAADDVDAGRWATLSPHRLRPQAGGPPPAAATHVDRKPSRRRPHRAADDVRNLKIAVEIDPAVIE